MRLLPEEKWKAVQKLADPKARPRELLANPDQALQLFQRLDGNNDGEVSLEEVPDPIADRFERILSVADRDDNSRLALEELRAFTRRLQALEKMQISKEEIDERHSASASNSLTRIKTANSPAMNFPSE